MVGNYFMRSRCQLITSPFWARYKKRTSPGSSSSFSDVCGKMHECIQYNEIHLFIVCPCHPACLSVWLCLCLSKGSLEVSCSCIGSGRRQQQRRLGTARCAVRGAWQHQQQQQPQRQTCPTKSSVPRRLTLNFFLPQRSISSRNKNCSVLFKNTL